MERGSGIGVLFGAGPAHSEEMEDPLVALVVETAALTRTAIAGRVATWRQLPWAALLAFHARHRALPGEPASDFFDSPAGEAWSRALETGTLHELLSIGVWTLGTTVNQDRGVGIDLRDGNVVTYPYQQSANQPAQERVCMPASDGDVVAVLHHPLLQHVPALLAAIPALAECCDGAKEREIFDAIGRWRIAPVWAPQDESLAPADALFVALAGCWDGEVDAFLACVAHLVATAPDIIDSITALASSWHGTTDELIAAARLLEHAGAAPLHS